MLKKVNKNILIISIIVVIIFIISIAIFLQNQIVNNIEYTNEKIQRVIETIENNEDIKNKFDISVDGIDGQDVKYYVEDNDIVRAEYNIDNMNMILRMSKNSNKDLLNIYHYWSTDVLMQVDCEDTKVVKVMANVSVDDNNVMKAEWRDNDTNYSMMTTNLTTREDFLQEIYRFVRANHINS